MKTPGIFLSFVAVREEDLHGLQPLARTASWIVSRYPKASY
jgi:hypothetical protein